VTRIFVTGDTHGDYDWHKLTSKSFPEQKELTKDDYVIIAPEETVCDIGMPKMSIRHINDLTMQLDTIAQTVSFKGWYFGHYHDDSDFGKYHLLYNRVVELEE